ncbi:MAG: hypothetical protein ACE5K1_03220 [Acidiferrobacterales bacterium]
MRSRALSVVMFILRRDRSTFAVLNSVAAVIVDELQARKKLKAGLRSEVVVFLDENQLITDDPVHSLPIARDLPCAG